MLKFSALSAGAAALAGAAGCATNGTQAARTSAPFPRFTVTTNRAGVAVGDLYYTYDPDAQPGAASGSRAARPSGGESRSPATSPGSGAPPGSPRRGIARGGGGGRNGGVAGAQRAAAITDSAGNPRWTATGDASYGNLRVQLFEGRPVLTYWTGSGGPEGGSTSSGRAVVTDLDHNEIATIRADGTFAPDVHEFFITPENTGLITVYHQEPADLSGIGGAVDGELNNSYWEEVDLRTGRRLMRWNALEHIPLTESQQQPNNGMNGRGFDYAHFNSVTTTPDGNILISARHTWTIYKVNRRTGEVMWRLGGKSSDFPLPPEAVFAWQHHAHFEDETTLRIFDNGSAGRNTEVHPSRVLWLEVNERSRTARVKQSITHPERISASAMGSAQRLPNGNTIVGWGSAARISEFAPTGEMLFDATLPSSSYRVYRFAEGETGI